MDTRITSLITDLIIETKKNGVDITNLVVFGSQSDGTATVDSDVDIAIISPFFKGLDSLERRRHIKPVIYYLIERYKIPLDLILLTPDEYSNESSIRMAYIRNSVSILVSV